MQPARGGQAPRLRHTRRGTVAAIPLHRAALGIDNFERDRRSGIGAKPEVNGGAVIGGIGHFRRGVERFTATLGTYHIRRREQMRRRGDDGRRQLAQRGKIIDDPEGATLRRDHEVVVAGLKIGNGRNGQATRHALPAFAPVERHEQSVLGARVEEVGALRILGYRAQRMIGGNAVGTVGQSRPAATIVVGAPEIWREVVESVGLHRHVGTSRLMRRERDLFHRAEPRHPRRSDLGPRRPAVARDVQATIVGADPECLGVGAVFGHGEDRIENLDARHVVVDGATGGHLMSRGVRGEIGRDAVPRHAIVTRTQQILGPVVHHVAVMARYDDRGHPLEAVGEILRRLTELELRIYDHVAPLIGPRVPAVDGATVAAAPEHVGMIGVECDRPRLAAGGIPVVGEWMQ